MTSPEEARELYQSRLEELRAFEAAPPDGWNFLGSPAWQRYIQLKEDVATAEITYSSLAPGESPSNPSA